MSDVYRLTVDFLLVYDLLLFYQCKCNRYQDTDLLTARSSCFIVNYKYHSPPPFCFRVSYLWLVFRRDLSSKLNECLIEIEEFCSRESKETRFHANGRNS